MKKLLPFLIATLIASTAVAQGPQGYVMQEQRYWDLTIDDREATLNWQILGVLDEEGPIFFCKPGEGVVHVWMFPKHRIAAREMRADGEWVDAMGKAAPWPARLDLRANRTIGVVLPAIVTPDAMSGDSMVKAFLPTASPVLRTFGETGVIMLTAFGEAQAPPPAPIAKVKAFLEACAKR